MTAFICFDSIKELIFYEAVNEVAPVKDEVFFFNQIQVRGIV